MTKKRASSRPGLRALAALCLLFWTLQATAQQEDANTHFKQGQTLFDAKQYDQALVEMKKVVEMAPNEPLGHAGVAACLNQLKQYPEAKKSLDEAFRLLQAQRATIYAAFVPIDIYYYALMADIDVNLHQFAEAVKALEGYTQQRMKEADKLNAPKALEAPKSALRTRLIAVGANCLDSGDLECGRGAFAQAMAMPPVATESVLRIAKESLNSAEAAPASTDQEKATKTALFQLAVEYFNRLPEVDRNAPETLRAYARALSGTQNPQDYDKAVQLLKSSTDSAAQLDLTAVYSNHENWEQVVSTATAYLQAAPKDARTAYCRRSFAYFKLKNCAQALEDGAKCTNADGSPRQAAYMDYCRSEGTRKATVETANHENTTERDCLRLASLGEYAAQSEVPLVESVDILSKLEASKSKCKGYLEKVDVSAICKAHVNEAKNPLNLSTMSKDDLKTLHDKTGLFLKLCSPSLDEGQKSAVSGAISTLAAKL